MGEEQTKRLCLALMRADSEEEVIGLLKEAGLWDNKDALAILRRLREQLQHDRQPAGPPRRGAGREGRQRRRRPADERVPSPRHRPGGPKGPAEHPPGGRPCSSTTTTTRQPSRGPDQELAQLQANRDGPLAHAGRDRCWSADRATRASRSPTCGEGQTPERMPDTFLSLTKSNKLRIPFVQGKFNMGGTGRLRVLRTRTVCN